MPKFVVLSICILYLAFHVQSIQRTNHSVSTDQVINSLLVVYQNLTSAQQRKVDKIIESTADGTDDEQSLTGKINSFVDGLHKSVQVTSFTNIHLTYLQTNFILKRYPPNVL